MENGLGIEMEMDEVLPQRFWGILQLCSEKEQSKQEQKIENIPWPEQFFPVLMVNRIS